MAHAEVKKLTFEEALPNRTVRRVVAVVAFAALTALGARLAVPLPGLPVPVTMQTLVVTLAGALLGPYLGAASQVLYLLAGISGLPVFALGSGFAYVFGPTGGYLLSYPVAAALTGLLAGRSTDTSFVRSFIRIAIAMRMKLRTKLVSVLRPASNPVSAAATGYDNRYPPVGPNTYAKPEPSANTGSPEIPASRYSTCDAAPKYGPSSAPASVTTSVCIVTGTGSPGSGTARRAPSAVSAAKATTATTRRTVRLGSASSNVSFLT